MDTLNEYFTEQELVDHTRARGLKPSSPRTLREWRQKGEGPPYTMYGRVVLYPRNGFAEWLASRITKPNRRIGLAGRRP